VETKEIGGAKLRARRRSILFNAADRGGWGEGPARQHVEEKGGPVWHGAWRGRGPAGNSSPRAAAAVVYGGLVTTQGKQREREREESGG
jgi:hypothetical protein